MKVVIATWFPKNPQAPRGGVESVSVNLVTALAAQPDVEVSVVTVDAGAKSPEIQAWKGLQIHRLPRASGSLLAFATQNGGRMVRDYILGLNPDVVHSHDTFGIMTRNLDAPRVFTIHGFIHEDTRCRGRAVDRMSAALWKWYETRCWAEQPHIISISPYVRERLRGIANGQIHDIENPVAREYFETAKLESPVRILCAAVISRRKNTIGLIRAFAAAAVPGAQLRLAGPITEPDYGESVRRTITELGLESSIELLGTLTTEQVRNELARAAVFALTSLEEGAPMGIAEALAMGIPVLTSNRCGMPYMVRHGETGFLVDPTNTADIAEHLRTLCLDSSLRQRLGSAGRASAEQRHHPDRVAERTVAVYRSAACSSATLLSDSVAVAP